MEAVTARHIMELWTFGEARGGNPAIVRGRTRALGVVGGAIADACELDGGVTSVVVRYSDLGKLRNEPIHSMTLAIAEDIAGRLNHIEKG